MSLWVGLFYFVTGNNMTILKRRVTCYVGDTDLKLPPYQDWWLGLVEVEFKRF